MGAKRLDALVPTGGRAGVTGGAWPWRMLRVYSKEPSRVNLCDKKTPHATREQVRWHPSKRRWEIIWETCTAVQARNGLAGTRAGAAESRRGDLASEQQETIV